MTHRITDRKFLKNSEWLATVATSAWPEVQAPPREGLRLQQFDLAAHVNTALAAQQIKDAFQSVVQEAGDSRSRGDRVASDGRMAVAVHKSLDGLTVREASDADFWAYLACFGCPQYVRWRWEPRGVGALWTRFAGNTRRSALSRLWWWAEITCDHARQTTDPQRYSITRNVRDRQSLMLWFIDCAFSGHSLIAHKLAAFQQQHSLNDIAQKAICRTVNRLARVVCLDSIGTERESEALCERALRISQLLSAP